MDDKLFDIFSEETDVPECVLEKVNETLEMIEHSAKADMRSEKTEKSENEKMSEKKKAVSREMNSKNKNFRNEKSRKKNWKRSLVLSFAAVLAFGATVFAAEKYIGISNFLDWTGSHISEDAQNLIEKEPVQQEDGDSIITYTVKEALCDKNSIRVVVEAKAKERGRYLLVGQDLLDEDNISNLGIESDRTVEEYAKEKKLTIVRVGANFDFNADMGITSSAGSYESKEDDVLYIYSAARKENQSSNLMVSCVGTAVLPDAKNVEDVMRTNITFQMEDKSQGTNVTYVPADTSEGVLTADGKVKILAVDVEETEIAAYATIHYITMEDATNISLDVTDSDGNPWQWSDIGGASPDPEIRKEAVCTFAYEKTELTEEIGVRAYDYENDVTYDPVLLKKQS